MSIDTLWKICVGIFSAGILVAGIRQLRKDLNGVSARGREEAKRADFRFLTKVVSTLVFEKDQDTREKLGKMFLEAGNPDLRR